MVEYMVEEFRKCLMLVCFVGIGAMILAWFAVIMRDAIVEAFRFFHRKPFCIVIVPLAVSLVLHGSTKQPPTPPSPSVSLGEVSTTADSLSFNLVVPEEMVGSSASVDHRKVSSSSWNEGIEFTITGTNANYTVDGDFVGGKEDRKVRVIIK